MINLKHLLGILWLISSVYCSSGGESTTFRKQDDHGNYAFGYDVNDGKGSNNFHKETGDEHGNKRGSYGILGADGQMRIVHYIADEHGFRVDIKSNEPGLAQGKDSANTIVNGKDEDTSGISDYSAEFGQRTPSYKQPAKNSLYLSSTSNHPSSKPYYLDSLNYKKDYAKPNAYLVHKPKHISYSHSPKSYYPKNLAYTPKYSYYQPKTYSKPTISYESTNYPIPVHKPNLISHDYSSNSYDPSVYGSRKSAYASDLYSKSAEPTYSYTKLSGYSHKKHEGNTKYYGDALSSSPSTYIPVNDESKNYSKLDNDSLIKNDKTENEDLAASYRTETNKNGVIHAKLPSLLGLTSYKNPYSIDIEHKSS